MGEWRPQTHVLCVMQWVRDVLSPAVFWWLNREQNRGVCSKRCPSAWLGELPSREWKLWLQPQEASIAGLHTAGNAGRQGEAGALCSQEQHSSTYGQVCALSAWWRTPLLKSSFWLLVLIFKNNNSVLHGNWPVGSLKIRACDLLLPGSSTATGAREWTFLQGMGWKPNDVSSSFTQAGCFYGHPDNTAVVNVHIGHVKTVFMV